LVSLYSNNKEIDGLKELKPYLEETFLVKNNYVISLLKALVSIFTPYSMEMGFCLNIRLLRLLFSLRNDYDYFYLKRLRMASYAFIFPTKKVFIDETDSMSLSYKNMYHKGRGLNKLLYIEEYLKYFLAERHYLKQYQFVLCSKNDIKYLVSKHREAIDPILLENGLDIDLWSNGKSYPRNCKLGNKLFFWGLLNYVPNRKSLIDFTSTIFPKLSAKYEFNIIGPGKRFDVPLKVRSRIQFLGFVDDITKEIKRFDIFICPLIMGTGIKNKVIQAAALGIPIVATEVAVDGIDEKLKNFFFIANERNYGPKIEEIQEMAWRELSSQMASQAKYAQERYSSTNMIKGFCTKYLGSE
jgi:glycosyltransferase involved in cell wall biosynthesis